MTAAEQLIERGRQEGLQKGLQKGRQEGLQEGRREALRTLLETRLGTLPEAIVARVGGADAEQLDRWFKSAITAPSFADVMGSA